VSCALVFARSCREFPVGSMVVLAWPEDKAPQGCDPRSEPGDIPEVFNAVGDSIAARTVAAFDAEPLRADEVLAVRPLSTARAT